MRKTDQVDSDVLALLLRADLIPVAHMIRPDQRGPRDLMRTRLRLVEKCVSAQNSVDRLLEKFNVPEVGALEGLYQLSAACHAAQIQLLTEQITTLERALYPHLIPTADVQRLLWIPGLGKVNAFTIYTEIDGITRFPSEHSRADLFAVMKRKDVVRPSGASQGLVGAGLSLESPTDPTERGQHTTCWGGAPRAHAAWKVIWRSGAASPCSSRSAMTRSANAWTRAMASSRLAP